MDKMNICDKNVLARGEKMVIAIDGFAPVGTDQVKVQTVEVIIIANMYITMTIFRPWVPLGPWERG